MKADRIEDQYILIKRIHWCLHIKEQFFRRKLFNLLPDLEVLMILFCVNMAHCYLELRILTSKQTELKVQMHTIVNKILTVTLGNIHGPCVTFYILLSWPF